MTKNLCSVCGADIDVWHEMMHEEHKCPPEMKALILDMIDLLYDAICEFGFTECNGIVLDPRDWVDKEMIKSWLEKRSK